MFIDTHCHLDFPEFNPDREEVIQRAKEQGIDYIINIGSSLNGSKDSLALAKKYAFIYAAVGYHPHAADKFNKEIQSALEELAQDDKVVAIGEVGLDYYKHYSGAESQKSAFVSLVRLAKDLSLPLVIHNRQAPEDTLKILKEFMPLKAVVHCFSGDENFLKICLDLGFFISFTCNITYKKAEGLRSLAKLTPLDRLFLETDAPFLPPEGFRGKRNEPLYVKYLAQEIARIKGITTEEIGRVTTDNAKKFFKIGSSNPLGENVFQDPVLMDSKVSIIKCKNYQSPLVQAATKKAIDLIGGITKFVKPESKVLVKPNLLMAKEPESGIDTHPEVVRAVIKILKEINCKIFVGDGPSVWGNQIQNVEEVYRRSGIKNVCEEEMVTLVKFDKNRWRGIFPLSTWLDNCDYLVNLPKFKTHDLTILTGAIKNLFGLVSGTYKTELHKHYFKAEDFSCVLVDIYEMARPALTIIDGIVAMEGEGPGTSGKLRNTGLLLASSDGVALDSILALIMGLEPQDILTTKEAVKRGLGIADINRIDILGEKLEAVIGEPFQLPAISLKTKIPRPIIELAKNLIRFYPKIEYNHCTLCGACIQICPQKVIRMQNKCVVIDYSGCISCFCCQEVCPSAAIKIKKSIVAKLIGL